MHWIVQAPAQGERKDVRKFLWLSVQLPLEDVNCHRTGTVLSCWLERRTIRREYDLEENSWNNMAFIDE
jgi:hypothetical protein